MSGPVILSIHIVIQMCAIAGYPVKWTQQTAQFYDALTWALPRHSLTEFRVTLQIANFFAEFNFFVLTKHFCYFGGSDNMYVCKYVRMYLVVADS